MCSYRLATRGDRVISINQCEFIDSSCERYELNDQLDQLLRQDVEFFDKDGYDLVAIEQLLYKQNGYQIIDILTGPHYCSHWVQIDHEDIFIDHSMILTRCDFIGDCRELIESRLGDNRKLQYFLQVRKKWGVDIDINQFIDGKIYEILHLELDTYDIDEARQIKDNVEKFLAKEDIEHLCGRIMSKYDEWSSIHGYNQNLWKAKYLGFECSEDTRKSI